MNNQILEDNFKNIHNLPMTTIREGYDIEVPAAHKKYGSGETWENWTKVFTKEPEDKIFKFHEFQRMLESIHPNLFIQYNLDINFGHAVYFFLAEDFPPLFICTVGRGADNEIPPESGFIGNQTELAETRQVYAGYKQCLFNIKKAFVIKGIKSRWDVGNADQTVEISQGK